MGIKHKRWIQLWETLHHHFDRLHQWIDGLYRIQTYRLSICDLDTTTTDKNITIHNVMLNNWHVNMYEPTDTANISTGHVHNLLQEHLIWKSIHCRIC